SGGTAVVAGGTAFDTVVGVGGNLNVTANGTEFRAQISGHETVGGANAIAASGTVFSGGIQDVLTGTAVSTTVLSGGTQNLRVIGIASGAILSGGTQLISSGAAATSTTISAGGTEIVNSGGVASRTILVSGQVIDSGLTVSTIISGGNEVVAG